MMRRGFVANTTGPTRAGFVVRGRGFRSLSSSFTAITLGTIVVIGIPSDYPHRGAVSPSVMLLLL